MLYMKVHSHEHSTIVALCDENLLGKILKDEKRQLDLKAYANFYNGELVHEKQAMVALRHADSVNLVGKESIGIGKKLGLLHAGDVILIAGIPHAQIYKI